jgi:IS1 family transposase
MAYVLTPEKQRMALNMLAEGASLRSVTRLTGIHRTTVMNLMVRFGDACRDFLDEEMRGLNLRHIQCDEIFTYVGKRQKNLRVEEKNRHDIGEIYLWTALDTDTKLVPTFVIGKRSADMARRLMVDLASRLNLPGAGSADRHAYRDGSYEPVVQISTDGFAAYPEAVDLAFGPFVKYGVVIKDYRNADRKPGNYSPAEIVATKRKARRGMDESEVRSICTSHVERNNLTIRTFMKRFNRLTLGFSKKLDNLAAATALHMAFYNFVWKPSTLKGITPAMAAGVTTRLWSFNMLFDEVKGRYLEW